MELGHLLTCPVSRIQKSLQSSAMIPSASWWIVFQSCRKGPKTLRTLILAAREGRFPEAWSGTWQANSNCIVLHGTKVCQSTQWWQKVGGSGTAPLILNLGIRWGWVVGVTSRPLYPEKESPSPETVWPFYADMVSWLGVVDQAIKTASWCYEDILGAPDSLRSLKKPHWTSLIYSTLQFTPLSAFDDPVSAPRWFGIRIAAKKIRTE